MEEQTAASVSTGINLVTTEIAHEMTLQNAGADGGESSGCDPSVRQSSPCSSFSVVWNAEKQEHELFKPIVVLPDGTERELDQPTIAEGRLSLKIAKTTSASGGEEYTFEWLSGEDGGTADDSADATAMIIPIVEVASLDEPDGIKQLHVGVIAVGGAATIKGDTDDSEAVSLSGAVEITGDGENGGQSGIVFKTVKGASGKPAKLYCDVSGRKGLNKCEHQNGWGAHEVTFYDSDGTERRFHFLGCRDVTLPGGSGGGVTSLYESESVDEKATGNVQLKGTDGIEIDVTPAVKDDNGEVITDATVDFSIGEQLTVAAEDEAADEEITLSASGGVATQTVVNGKTSVETSATDTDASCNAKFGNNTSSILKASDGGATCDLVTGSDKVSIRAFGSGRAAILLVGRDGNIDLDTAAIGGKSVAIHNLKVVNDDGTSTDYKILANDDITLTKGGGAGKRLVDVSFNVDTTGIKATKKFIDENGNKSTEEVLVCKLTTKEVVTGSKYDCPNFTISKSSVTVVGDAKDLDDETVFTSTPHSTET